MRKNSAAASSRLAPLHWPFSMVTARSPTAFTTVSILRCSASITWVAVFVMFLVLYWLCLCSECSAVADAPIWGAPDPAAVHKVAPLRPRDLICVKFPASWGEGAWSLSWCVTGARLAKPHVLDHVPAPPAGFAFPPAPSQCCNPHPRRMVTGRNAEQTNTPNA